MSKKKIGIVGWKTGDNSFGCTVPYLDYWSKYGQVEILTPSKDIRKDINLLVLPGGADVSSILYNEVPGFRNTNPDLFKEYFFRQTLQHYIDAGVPIYGTCLGMQMIAVYFGAKLFQDISAYHPYSQSREELTHKIIARPALIDIVGSDNFQRDEDVIYEDGSEAPFIEVNSLHHQAIDNNTIPKCIEVLADSDDGYVEVIRHTTLPIYGCQYHSEEIDDIVTEKIVKLLLK